MKLSIAWLYMWAFSYFIVAFVAPQIGGDPVLLSALVFFVYGLALFLSVFAIAELPYAKIKIAARWVLLVLAIISVYSGVVTWTGTAIWNVPFANKEVFQVSMAFADLVAAAFIMDVALHE